MSTHLVIRNRAASVADGWIHIVPRGELPNRAAGIVQVLDDAALDAILAGIAADRARLGDKWPGVYAGREHFIYNDEADSAALAWFKDFEKRDDGLWAKADGLTPVGRQVLANGDYKFTSFVADRRDTQDLGNGRVRILKLDTVGFTNQANGKELLTPITNRGDSTLAEPGGSAANQKQTTKGTMTNIATKLGLAAEASEEAILDAISKLQEKAGASEPVAAENTDLKNRLAALDSAQVDSVLSQHGVKEPKLINRLKPVLLGHKPEDRAPFLVDCGFKPASPNTGRVLNRADATPASLPADEQQLARKQQEEVEDYRIKNRCSYEQARNQVRRLKPELFGLS